MGRKQKLRQAKRNTAAAAAKKDPPQTNTATTTNNNNNSGCSRATINIDAVNIDTRFPISDFYVRGMDTNTDLMERFDLLKRGAIEHGCLHSMVTYAHFSLCVTSRNLTVHLAIPWYLEGAIRGSRSCVIESVKIYTKDEAVSMKALTLYWMKMSRNFAAWDTSSDSDFENLNSDGGYDQLNNIIEQSCAICGKEDTESLTLKQCIGCSACCYCSQECQTAHWEEHNHRGECKQLKILEKYHKPYAKEIYEAIIRGDTNIPALEKLRYKLGLSRPLEDYVDLDLSDKGEQFIVGRKDGTLWVGSFPGLIGQHVKWCEEIAEFVINEEEEGLTCDGENQGSSTTATAKGSASTSSSSTTTKMSEDDEDTTMGSKREHKTRGL